MPPLIGVSACVIAQRHDLHAAADQYVRALASGAGGRPAALVDGTLQTRVNPLHSQAIDRARRRLAA